MKISKKITQIIVVVLFAFSVSSCTEDETMNELMETVEKYNLEDLSEDGKKNEEKTDPLGG